ncbi:hypothetical protein MNB_SM-3-975 [hydrothermal vent metagenome]|uniref:Uncharacterized protein n=1 Tax=hydrothermal vent metagenome TaxID=652676 RepID=A0A1W1D481_9ZZZZ
MFTHLFQIKKTLKVPESLLLKRLKATAIKNNLFVYDGVVIFYERKHYHLPLIIFDENRGLYLFEHKQWTYDELKNSTIKTYDKSLQADNTLTYTKFHQIFQTKLEQFFKGKKLPIHNFLLMENLDEEQYERLDDSFKKLLPKSRIFFSDLKEKAIIKKLFSVSKQKKKIFSPAQLFYRLLFQYTILDDTLQPKLATQQQIDFIYQDIIEHSVLNGRVGSGKSATLATKVIFEHLKNRYNKILVIKANKMACDFFMQKLQAFAQDKTLMIDFEYIEVLTPKEVLQKHLSKLGKKRVDDKLVIEKWLLRKRSKLYNLIFCDDADFLPADFITYLLNVYKKIPVLFVSNSELDHKFSFDISFKEQSTLFFQDEPYEKTISLVKELLRKYDAKDIMIVSDPPSRTILYTEFKQQLEIPITLLDNTKTSQEQNLETLVLSTYYDFFGIEKKYIIILDICLAPYKELAYLFFLSKEQTYLIYEEECDVIVSLKNFEQIKEIKE